MKKYTKCLFMAFPVLYFLDVFLGFNGRMFMLGGLSDRMILFALATASLYIYLLAYLIKNKISLFGFKNKDGFLGSFTIADTSLLVLFVSVLIFTFAVPAIKGTSLSFAVDEASCIAVLVMYFPLSFLIRKGEISAEKFELKIEILTVLLGIYHIVLYFGEKISKGFIESLFSSIISMLGGTGTMPTIIFGNGYIRVIYTTSVLLVFGIYFIFKHFNKLRVIDCVCLFVTILAAMATVTKGLWLGLGIGVIVFAVAYLIIKIKQKDKGSIIRLFAVAAACIAVVCIFDFTAYDGIVSIRIKNLFLTSSSPQNQPQNPDNEMMVNDMVASAESNDLKIVQIKKLVEKWEESPLIGFGYGSYTEDCIRSVDAPFSYEMTAFALLMKVGIIGLAFWAFFIISVIVNKAKKTYKTDKTSFWAWLGLFAAFGFSVQTNPYLFNFVGMTVLMIIAVFALDNPKQSDAPKIDD